EALMGFRSMPSRLGGGFVVWSADRTYRADSWLGDLRPIVDTGADGGVRPGLDAIVVRSELGVLEIDPKTLAVRRTREPGLADAIALDGVRALRVDRFGRAKITTDGGHTYTDLHATRGLSVARVDASDADAGKLVLEVEKEPKLLFDGTVRVSA